MQIFGYTISRKKEERSGIINVSGPRDVWGQISESTFNLTGLNVTAKSALSVPGIWAAVKTIAETLASLPFDLYERTENGSALSTNHPIFNLLKLEPSEFYSAYELKRTLMVHACFGDGFARIYRNGVGRPTELRIMPMGSVDPFENNGRLYYVCNINGTREVVSASDMIHIKGLSLDGIDGLNVASVHRETLGMSIAANEYGAAFFGNGAHVGGVVTYPGELKPEQRTTLLRKLFGQNTGVPNVGKNMVLDGGMTYTKIGLTPAEAMLNDARNFQVNESARIFGIPAHLLQQLDRATFNNIETMNTQFVSLCLRPWAVQIEQEFTRKMLSGAEKASGRYFVRFNLDGLLRGDTAARAQYYNTMFNIGAMSPNDIRELENMNRRDGGDEYFVPLNMAGSDQPQDQAQPITDTTQSDGATQAN